MMLSLVRGAGRFDADVGQDPTQVRPSRLPRWPGEVLLVGVFYGAYDATRGLRHGSVAAANHNGWLLLHAERHLHLAPEHGLNELLWRLPGLAVPSAYFYATLHFIVTPAVLIWLYRRHPKHYRRARTVLAIATVTALVGFWLYPATPPRLLPASGIRDTLADVHQWGWWSGPTSAPRGFGGLANEFAAMPSLHMAWALWAGWLIARHAEHRVTRALGIAYPVLTAFVVMSTGNHYLLDVLAGGAMIAAAALLVNGTARSHAHQGGRLSDDDPE
jgi:membrane-associated phospholipid phosphatase